MKNQVILIIDNDDAVREATARVLSCCGYANVLQATNGQQGIKMIGEHNPDLVITALTMPGMCGEEVARWISREHKPAHSSIKIIALGGGDHKMVEPVVKAAGCDALLPKLSGLSSFRSTTDLLLGIPSSIH